MTENYVEKEIFFTSEEILEMSAMRLAELLKEGYFEEVQTEKDIIWKHCKRVDGRKRNKVKERFTMIKGGEADE